MEDSSLSASKEIKFSALPDSVCLEECQKQLRSIYKTRNKVKIIPWDQSSAVHMDEIYTDLSRVGMRQEKLDHYTEIFAPRGVHPAPKRILVYGQPGIGKTVFTLKTTFDWSQQKFPRTLGTFDLVLLVRLRDVCNLQDVPSILGASEVLASDAPNSVDNLYDYVLRHQEKVLLILDGYDEYVYSTENQSPVFKIWTKNQLRGCCVIITSSNIGADTTLRNFSDTRFMINGFNHQRQKEFARRFLKDDKNVEEFFKYLEQHNLRKLAQIPLLLLMLCLLWMGKDHKGLPQKRGHIFGQFVETLIDHIHVESVVMKQDYTAELYALGRLAFEALLQDCLYFPISKFPRHKLIERLIELGLFQMSSLGPENGVFFSHKSVQEYLAANFLKEELVSKTSESKNFLSQLNSIIIKTIRKLFEVSKFTCDLSEEAAREIMVQLGMAAKKEGLTEYSFDSETPTVRDLSKEQKHFIDLCQQLLFYCSAETRKNLFSTFLSSLGGVFLIDSDELNVVVNEELVKTTEAPKYIFFREHEIFRKDNKYTEKDYLNLITLTQQLNAVIVSCSGEMKASEFLSNFTWRRINEFFLKKEKTTYLYFCRIVKNVYKGIDLPHKMIRELINYPESRKKTKINPAGESSEQACSTEALSRVWRIEAWDVNMSDVELLSDVLPFLLAPQEILIVGKDGEEYDSDMAKKILSDINPTHRLKGLTLSWLNVQSSAAGFIVKLIKQSPNLEHLSLSFNPLLGEGVDAITQHLGSTPHLRSLELRGVKMTAEQVQHLTEEAMKHSSITYLRTRYHDRKGNLLPDVEWPSEEYWKMLLSQLIPDLKQQQIVAQTRPSIHDAPFPALDLAGSVETFPVPPDPADSIPASVRARGPKALAAYLRALETGGSTYDKRVKILVVGQDRVGKTSLSKALRGEPFDEAELSTDGVQMMPAVKNAGTGPWRNPASLEHTTVYDHKIAKKTAELLFSTREEQPANREPTATTGDRPQKPTETTTNRKKPTETSTVKRPREPKVASNKTVQSSFRDENADEGKTPTSVHQEKKVPRMIQKNEGQDPARYQEKPFHVPQEEKIPETVALVLEENLQEDEIDSDENIWPVVWDFAGQDVYRAVHPIFMSSEDIYLLVFDLTKKLSEKAVCRVNVGHKEQTVTARDSEDTNLDHLLRWMDLIHSLRKDVQDVEDSYTPVILVGTHADCVDDPSKEMEVVEKTLTEELGEMFLRHIVGQLSIDNKNVVDQEEIIELRNLVLQSANEMPQTKKKIPLQWHLVEKKILTEPVWQREKYLTKESFGKKLRENIVSCRFENEDDFDELVYFLHGRGTIVYYEHKHADQKEGLIFLDPKWLIYLLCKIIKVIPDEKEPLWVKKEREKLGKEGVLSEKLINYTCKKESVDLIKSYLISLMDKFNLICKWPEKTEETTTGEERFLVPCMLSSRYKEENEEIDFCAPIYLNFKTEYVPSGLFCRLVVLFGKTPHLENTHKLHANEAQFALDNENHVLQLLCYKKVIKLRISAGPHGISQVIYDNIVSQLNVFLERLRKECHWLHSMSVTFRARCTLCINTTPCHRHEKNSCGHHDCSHYISLDAPSLCCEPGKLLEVKPLMPWILAVKKLKPSRSRPNSHDETRPSQGIVKNDVVSDYDLEGLSLELGNSWECLARRLEFSKAEIENFNNPTCSEKQLKMLQRWKQKLGRGATYQVLYDALCHGYVNRKDLAQSFCIDNNHAAEYSASVNSRPQDSERFIRPENVGHQNPTGEESDSAQQRAIPKDGERSTPADEGHLRNRTGEESPHPASSAAVPRQNRKFKKCTIM